MESEWASPLVRVLEEEEEMSEEWVMSGMGWGSEVASQRMF
jgi:hypothetical protein